MNAITRKITVALALVALAVGVTEGVAQPPAPRVVPGPYPDPYNPVPQLGFYSQCIPGYGERVTYVRPYSKAARIGLEVGDVILSVNGRRLTHPSAWYQEVQAAASQGGWLRLRIRDVRTGWVVSRATNLFYDSGHPYPTPPLPKSAPVPHTSPTPHAGSRPHSGLIPPRFPLLRKSAS